MNVSVNCYYHIRLFVVHRDYHHTPKPKAKSNKFRPNVAAWRMGKTCIPQAAMMIWNDFGKQSIHFVFIIFFSSLDGFFRRRRLFFFDNTKHKQQQKLDCVHTRFLLTRSLARHLFIRSDDYIHQSEIYSTDIWSRVYV